jgi:WD40 repeat protein
MQMIKVTKVGHFTGHRDSIYSIGPGMEASSFISTGSDGMVAYWLPKEKEDGSLLVKLNAAVYSQLLIESQKLILLGTREGNLHVVDLAAKKEIRNFRLHVGGIFSIIFLQDDIIATAGEDGCIVVLRLHDFSVLQSLRISEKSVRCLQLNPSGNILAAGSSDHLIRLISLPDFNIIHTLASHQNSVFTVAFSPLGNHLYSGGRDAVLKVWEVYEGRLIKDINAHWFHINDIQVSPDNRFIASCSMDKSIRLWDAEKLELLKVIDAEKLDAHRSSVNKLLWLTGQELLSCSDDRSVQLFRVEC